MPKKKKEKAEEEIQAEESLEEVIHGENSRYQILIFRGSG